MSKFPTRGEIYWANLDPAVGSEIQKTRPVVVISNNTANEFSSRVIVAPVTSKKIKKVFPFEVLIEIKGKQGKILLDQVRAIDKSRLNGRLGTCEQTIMILVNEAIRVALALND